MMGNHYKNVRPLLIRTFRLDKETLYIPSIEGNIEQIFSCTKLYNTQDKPMINIKYIENNKVVVFELQVGDIKCEVRSFRAGYSYIDDESNNKSVTNISNTVN